MRRSTQTKIMWFGLGAVVVLMNIGGLGLSLANILGKNIEYGD